jgi:hypothetical protein
MSEAWSGIISVALAITGIAIIAVILSKNSNTQGVIGAATQGFAADIGAAVSPITGGSMGGFNNLQSPTFF